MSTAGVMTRADADAIRAAGLDFRVYGVKSRKAFKQAAMLCASGFTSDFWDEAFKWAEELGADYRPVARRLWSVEFSKPSRAKIRTPQDDF